jgi:hypothetical protein
MGITNYNINTIMSNLSQYMEFNTIPIIYGLLCFVSIFTVFMLYTIHKKSENKFNIMENKISTHANIIKELNNCLIGQDAIICKFNALYQQDKIHYDSSLEENHNITAKLQKDIIEQNMTINLINNLEYDMPICIGKISQFAYNYDNNNSDHRTPYIEIKPIYVSSLIEILNIEEHLIKKKHYENENNRFDIITLYVDNFRYLHKLKIFRNTTMNIQNVLYSNSHRDEYNKQFTLNNIIHLPIESITYNFTKIYRADGMRYAVVPDCYKNHAKEYNEGDNDKLLNSIDNLYKFSKLNTIHFTNMNYNTTKLYKLLKQMNFKILEQTFDPSNKDITWSVHATRI